MSATRNSWKKKKKLIV